MSTEIIEVYFYSFILILLLFQDNLHFKCIMLQA